MKNQQKRKKLYLRKMIANVLIMALLITMSPVQTLAQSVSRKHTTKTKTETLRQRPDRWKTVQSMEKASAESTEQVSRMSTAGVTPKSFCC